MSLERQLRANIRASALKTCLAIPSTLLVPFACMEGPLLRMKGMSRRF